MKRVALLSLCLLMSFACATGPGPKPEASHIHAHAAPPIIDREVLFDDPEIAGGTLSPNGQFISFLKPYKGVMNIWVKSRNEAFEKARPLTADIRPVSGSYWSRDSKLVLYAQDKGGDENFHLYAVDPAGAADATTGVPIARDLTPGNKLQARVIAVPKATPDQVIVSLNDRDPAVHDVWRLSLSTGKKELIIKNTINAAGFIADLTGKVRLAVKQDEQGGTQVLRVDGEAFKAIYSCNAQESCGPLKFHKDGKRVYFETNKGDPDLTRLTLLDVDTMKEEFVEEDPDKQVDLSGVEFSEKTDELVATMYEGDRMRIYPRHPDFENDLKFVKKMLPQGDVRFASSTADDQLHIVIVTSDVDPGAAYLYDRQAQKLDFLYRPRPRLPVQHLVEMKPVRINARDGVVVPAYLSLPKGVDAKGLPAVLLVHGGPWARDRWGYNSFAQFLANRGYAVLQPNFRGSEGFGKKFLNLGNGQWGTGTMQHDLSDARDWLVKQGIADEKRVAIMGGSYGGYATLAGVAFTPDLYNAGVDIVGPSNIVTLLNTIPPYWAPIKKMFAVRVGDLDKPADVERLKTQSPLYSAKKIKAPLLVIQGANDPRVKQAEADQIVMALRDAKLPVEYMVAPDEGHGFRGRENRMAMMTAIESFLGKHLKGRVQETVSPEIAAKLATLMVDPSKVTLTNAEEMNVPQVIFGALALKPSDLKYRVAGNLGGRAIEGSSTVSVKKAPMGKGWVVTSNDKLPMGEVADITTLDAKTFLPSARNVTQGPVNIQMTYEGMAIKGAIEMQGKKMPIEAKGEHSFVSDGAALAVALTTMKLAPGMKAAATTFDLQSGKPQRVMLSVVGSESVTVPAKSFDAWRVDIASANDSGTTSVWVEKANTRRVVKVSQMLPQGMGQLSYELTK